MTAAEYREKAVRLLTSKPIDGRLTETTLLEAGVWASLAQSAAISESAEPVAALRKQTAA